MKKRFLAVLISAILAIPVLAAAQAAFKMVSGQFASSGDTGSGIVAEVMVSTATRVPWVTIRAKAGNSATVHIGDSGITGSTGHELSAKDSITFGGREKEEVPIDLNKIYVRASTGDGVTFLYPVAQ